jgi:hypothetical protein
VPNCHSRDHMEWVEDLGVKASNFLGTSQGLQWKVTALESKRIYSEGGMALGGTCCLITIRRVL